jgi:hypothetical protein
MLPFLVFAVAVTQTRPGPIADQQTDLYKWFGGLGYEAILKGKFVEVSDLSLGPGGQGFKDP